jgi:hypothetical protein
VETGKRDEEAWQHLAEQAHFHRSPQPFSLAVGA